MRPTTISWASLLIVVGGAAIIEGLGGNVPLVVFALAALIVAAGTYVTASQLVKRRTGDTRREVGKLAAKLRADGRRENGR